MKQNFIAYIENKYKVSINPMFKQCKTIAANIKNMQKKVCIKKRKIFSKLEYFINLQMI